MKKVIIIVACVVAVLLTGLIAIALYNTPKSVFKREFGFSLPESSKVENYDNSLFDESLYMKIKINEADYENVKNELIEYFNKHDSQSIDDFDLIPTYSNTCSWWNLNNNDVIFAYRAVVKGKNVKTIAPYAFITKDTQNQYYLFIAR